MKDSFFQKDLQLGYEIWVRGVAVSEAIDRQCGKALRGCKGNP